MRFVVKCLVPSGHLTLEKGDPINDRPYPQSVGPVLLGVLTLGNATGACYMAM